MADTGALSAAQQFITSIVGPAQDSEKETGVPAAVTIAQAVLESDWGASLLAKEANNYFGIKATSGPGSAGVIKMDTWEVLGGGSVTVADAFKAYHTLEESFIDHGEFLRDNPRYAAAFKFTSDPAEFARQVAAAGYATDPAYASKLIALIQAYGLERYDVAR